jgi:transcriptional regulator with XRE-family HTH domain
MQEKKETIKITVAHVRGARGLLGWNLADLAQKSGISAITISKWENNKSRPTNKTREAIQRALEDAGIEFSNGGEPGVKRRRLPV